MVEAPSAVPGFIEVIELLLRDTTVREDRCTGHRILETR